MMAKEIKFFHTENLQRLRLQILCSIGASDSPCPARRIRSWLKDQGNVRLAEVFDIDDYSHLLQVEELIFEKYCPGLLTA